MNLPGLFKEKYSAFTTTIIYAIAALVCIMVFRRIFYPALPQIIQSNTFADVLFIAITALFLFYILSGKDTRSKKLEDAIAQSEHRWRLTFEEANDPIFILDKNLNIQQVNSRAKELYGYNSVEFKKLNLINIRSEKTRNQVDLKELALRENKGLNYEIEHVKKDGTVFNVSVSTKVIVRSGQVEYVNIMHDLTERKKIEDQLVKSEKKYRDLIETAPVGILISIEGRLEYANPEFVRIIGANNDKELIGREVLNFIDPRHHEAVAERRRLVMQGQRTPEIEQVWKKVDGTDVYLSVSAMPFVSENSRGVQVLVKDITERKKSEEQIIENQARLNGIVESAMDAIITIGSDRKIILFNNAAEKMFLCSAVETIGSEINRFIPQHFRHIHDSHIDRFASTGETSRSMGKLNPISGVRANGKEFPIEASISKIEVNGEMLFTVILRDITGKVKAEESLNESRMRLKGIVDSAMDAIVTVDNTKKIILFNEAAEKMFLCPSVEAIGSEINRFIPQRFRHIHDSHIDRFASTGETSRSMGKLNAVSGVRANGEEFPIEASISKIEVNGEMLFTVILRDITEKLKTEVSVKETNERLHDLAAHLQTIREDERKMLAREIHDQLGQELTALKIDISFLGKKINKLGGNGETAEILENLNEMSRLTDHTINTVRRIAKELRPDMLDKLGLKEAVLWMCEDFEKRTGINCKVNIPLDFGFGGNLDTTIFRIIQESLTNAVRHSGGNEVKVSADIKDDTIKVIIEDNGKGISEEEIKNTKSLGLLGIRERAYSEGGTLAIQNGAERGARLILTIPFKQS